MSIMLSASSRKLSSSAAVKQSSEIAKRDMSQKKKVIRKVTEKNEDGKVQVTARWTLDPSNGGYTISFSRDNLHVWINGTAVENCSYITDKGYDVDLFFDLGKCKGHIYSDVEGNEMMNYLLIDGEVCGQDYQTEKSK